MFSYDREGKWSSDRQHMCAQMFVSCAWGCSVTVSTNSRTGVSEPRCSPYLRDTHLNTLWMTPRFLLDAFGCVVLSASLCSFGRTFLMNNFFFVFAKLDAAMCAGVPSRPCRVDWDPNRVLAMHILAYRHTHPVWQHCFTDVTDHPKI